MISLIIIAAVLASASAEQLWLPCEYSQNVTWRTHDPINMTRRQTYVSNLYNFSMVVDAKDRFVSRFIAQNGTWEPHNIKIMAHFVKQGSHVLNIGSQVGLEAILMGKIIGPTGKLFIFQPYKISHKIVTKNVYLNDLEDITTIYNTGASDTKKNHTITVDYSNTGAATIISTKPRQEQVLKAGYEIVNISLDRVDALLPSDVKIDFALIDVESMEVRAMAGMKEVIKRSKDRLVIMVQWTYGSGNPNHSEQLTIDLLDFFWENGFRAYTYIFPQNGKCELGKFKRIFGFSDLRVIKFMDLYFISSAIQVPQ